MGRKGVGSLRRSQVVTSFGPGATVDLPDLSVIVGGLDWWRGWDREQIVEPRLQEKAALVLGVPRLKLYSPPAELTQPGAPLVGIGVEEFPLWFVADYEVRRGQYRSRPLVHRNSTNNGKYTPDGVAKAVSVTPVRFVQACPNGHIADIEWYEFTHGGRNSCRRPLWLEELGTSGDLTDHVIRCDCGAQRALAQATRPSVLGQCKGQRPWLPTGEQCGGAAGPAQMMRLLIRAASNAYYPQKLSVLSLPEASDRVRTSVIQFWTTLQAIDSAEKLSLIRQLVPAIAAAFATDDDATVLSYIRAHKEGHTPPRRKIKVEEFDALSAARESIGEDVPEGDFFARRLAVADPVPSNLKPIERVILVHRLREVTAQIGFTRFEAVVPDLLGEFDIDVRRADIASEVSWLPAVETRGEGVFLKFRQSALEEWHARPAVRAREEAFRRALALAENTPLDADIRYVMLHSLAHLLITAVSLDCGYNASSMRERIYVTESGCGILLYTGTADIDGTLGGLVQAGRRIDQYLQMAFDLARLCSNDPVCAQHSPDQMLEERYSLGAACHGCLLIAETSCERRNELLDRSLVISTVERLGCEFFVEPSNAPA